ncbi:hypothetical protein BDV96DRAFT_485793 [Lophiotrema nucula]|uniref:Microtubule associated protein n=1 Tax=Lophiotrema nucula TaxID=690887 RepID=A0A6A5ZKF3_9PLEO|nr:hypothetical protein BDV96DRAFT_485793 [Lophiotrema nucula]
MVQPTRPPKNSLNATMRKLYNPLGFTRFYNFILWFIFAGALFGFVLARFMYLNFSGIFCSRSPSPGNSAAPGECYYYVNFNQYKVGIIMHLATILPAGVLVVLQFTPAIRHKAIMFHRINGYVVLMLYVVSMVGCFMIIRHAFGGGLDTQAGLATIAIASIVSFVLSYINIKRLQIEQHRAWMLRGWFYAGCIITERIIQISAAQIISKANNYFTTRPCYQIDYIYNTREPVLAIYPECEAYYSGTNPGQQALVHATMNNDNPVEIGAALGISFGMAIWLAFAIHAIGVEIYLHLTPREAERLRNVSYQRQLEAGMRNAGSAGLTVNRLGDAEDWVPQQRKGSENTLVGHNGAAVNDKQQQTS